jgi:nicotinate-nucleotide pyrophosphorylase (carboxylating)
VTADNPAGTAEVAALIATALDEDLRYGPDVTTAATVPDGAVATVALVSRQPGVLAGLDIALQVFDAVIGTDGYEVIDRLDDGAVVEPGTVVATLRGPVAGLLVAERTALNLLCHLSGIASVTALWVAELDGTAAKVRDSRKTLPGMRLVQKYAVRCGGGENHRMGLGDAALIKDNHVAAAGSVTAALEAVRAKSPDVPCEVEVDSLEQLDEALTLHAELVLLDNFPLWQTQMAVQRRNSGSPQTKLESSGGLSLDVAQDYARTGVEYLAVGALTHSVTALDLGFDWIGD